MKNTTRISSLMGTWTGQARLKAAVGPYELQVYFVVHLMPDPLRGYGCDMGNACRELDNRVCILGNDNASSSSVAEKECVDLAQHGQVTWSDVSAFFYFGARVDAGIPFNVHLEHNTGGWAGPLSVVLAQNTSIDGGAESNTSSSGGSSNVVDQYVARYVQSPSTRYLHMNPNCSLFSPEDFERYMGPSAVKETVEAQPNATRAGQDPYGAYLKTCDNGNVKPILPLFDFVFVNDTTGTEKVEVKLDYKILTFPKPQAPMYKLFPTLQERMNKRNGDFHISGPYCYGDDPKRGWTFDFNYDSKNDYEYMTLVHGCVEGLPCLPPAAQIALGGTGVDLVHVNGKTGTFGTEALLTIAVYALVMALLVSITFHCRKARHDDTCRQQARPQSHPPIPGPFGDLGEHHELDQPLLQENDDAASECKEDGVDSGEATANVQFV